MKKTAKIAVIVLCAIAAAAVVFAVLHQRNDAKAQPDSEPAQEALAPDFTVKLNNGDTFTLSEHKDQVVLINFWATWCPPCVGELPAFERLKNDNLDGLEIVAVNRSERKSAVDSFVAENGYTFHFAYDENGAVGRLYPTDGIPYTLIIKNGVIEKTFLGVPRNAYLTYKNAIEECLEK